MKKIWKRLICLVLLAALCLGEAPAFADQTGTLKITVGDSESKFDRKGIIAHVSGVLYEHGINILDISQTIVGGYFNMMMIVDMDRSEKPFKDTTHELEQIGGEIGVVINCQSEDIFNMMHRI